MTDRETIALYGRKADEYERMTSSAAEHAALAQFMASLPKGARLFDLGCGPGHQAAAMLARGFEVYALDATPEFVAAAQAKGVKARLGRFEDLTEERAYDGVCASFSLLHAPRAEFPTHLAAIARALKPSGRLLLGMKLGAGEKRDGLGRFYSYFTEGELAAHLHGAGFGITNRARGEGVGLAGDVDPFILIQAQIGGVDG